MRVWKQTKSQDGFIAYKHTSFIQENGMKWYECWRLVHYFNTTYTNKGISLNHPILI